MSTLPPALSRGVFRSNCPLSYTNRTGYHSRAGAMLFCPEELSPNHAGEDAVRVNDCNSIPMVFRRKRTQERHRTVPLNPEAHRLARGGINNGSPRIHDRWDDGRGGRRG